MICASEKFAVTLHLSPGNNHDAPEGRKLIKTISSNTGQYLLMDRAYEDDKTRVLALNQGFSPIVPPKKNRKKPWNFNSELYKLRNQVERFFLRLKRFRRIFTRYDKLDITYFSFILFALIVDAVFM